MICLTDFGSSRICESDGFHYPLGSCLSTMYHHYSIPRTQLLQCSRNSSRTVANLLRSRHVELRDDVAATSGNPARRPRNPLFLASMKSIQELQMCQTIFSFLGENPSEESWPDLRSIPLIPVVTIEATAPLSTRLRRLIPSSLCSDSGIRLLCRLLRLVPSDRATVEEVLSDAYFEDCVYERVQRGELGENGAER